MVFTTVTKLCNHHHHIIPEHFHYPNKKPCTKEYIFIHREKHLKQLILKDIKEAYSSQYYDQNDVFLKMYRTETGKENKYPNILKGAVFR